MKKPFSHYFPTPSYLNMDSCSFDISDESIKYGQLSIASSGFVFNKFGKEKIPEGVLVSGKIEDEEKLVAILKKLRIKNKLNFVRISLPEEQIYIFTLTLPQMRGQDLKEIILLQIEEHIPLKATEVVFDYDTLKEDEKTTTVGVTAISIEVVESYLSVFNQAGLTPLSFESEAQAIARSVIPRYEKGSVMIVDFGYTRTGISISYNGNVLLTTTLDLGGYDLTEMLAKNFSISFEKAEEMKRSYGLDNTIKTNKIFPVLLNGLSVLHDELEKQYIYWKTHNAESGFTHEKITHIILCGGNANLAGVADYLEDSMKIPVELANVWVNIFKMKTSVPEVSFGDSLSYATILGLGLNGFFAESQSVVNVLPPSNKKAIRKKYWIRLIATSLGFFTMIEMLLIILLIPPYFLSVSKEKLAENRLETLNNLNPEIKTLNIEKTIKNINNKLTFLSNKNLNQQISENIFGQLLKNKPSGILLTQILYNKKTDGSLALDLHGTAKNRAVLSAFKLSLDNNLNYKSVNLPISSFLKKTNLNFTISIVLK